MKGTPIEVAEAIADRFLRIPRESLDYMYHVGVAGLLDLYGATREQKPNIFAGLSTPVTAKS